MINEPHTHTLYPKAVQWARHNVLKILKIHHKPFFETNQKDRKKKWKNGWDVFQNENRGQQPWRRPRLWRILAFTTRFNGCYLPLFICSQPLSAFVVTLCVLALTCADTHAFGCLVASPILNLFWAKTSCSGNSLSLKEHICDGRRGPRRTQRVTRHFGWTGGCRGPARHGDSDVPVTKSRFVFDQPLWVWRDAPSGFASSVHEGQMMWMIVVRGVAKWKLDTSFPYFNNKKLCFPFWEYSSKISHITSNKNFWSASPLCVQHVWCEHAVMCFRSAGLFVLSGEIKQGIGCVALRMTERNASLWLSLQTPVL